MLMNPYLVRTSRWLWMNTTSMDERAASPLMEVLDPGHPIFSGVDVPADARVAALDPDVDTGEVTFVASTDIGNGTLVSKAADLDYAFVAEWEAGVEFYEGSGQIPANDRMLFTAGVHPATAGYGGEYNLTDDGLTMFLNAVNYLLGGEERLTAWLPNPTHGAQDVPQEVTLNWRAGAYAATHNVYFSTSFDDVNEANEAALVSLGQTETTYAIAEALEMGRVYYWRVDEVNEANADSPWLGDVWNFKVFNYVVVDDFEAYNDEDNVIYDTWLDGYVNGTTSVVGHLQIPYTEQTIVRSGNQSMPFSYDNFSAPYYAEAQRPWDTAQDFSGGVSLVLWVRGDADNSEDTLYVGLDETAVDYGDTTAIQSEDWLRWEVPLTTFSDAGVDLTAVSQIILGVGERDNPTSGFGGMLYVDDIRIYLPDPE
jgi:hypothetical protein